MAGVAESGVDVGELLVEVFISDPRVGLVRLNPEVRHDRLLEARQARQHLLSEITATMKLNVIWETLN